MPIKHNETRFTDTHLPIRIQKSLPPPIHSFSLFTPPPRQFYIDGVLPPGDTFFWNSPYTLHKNYIFISFDAVTSKSLIQR